MTYNTVSSNNSGDTWSVYKANNKKADMKTNHCEQKSRLNAQSQFFNIYTYSTSMSVKSD